MPRSILARLGPAWALAALLLAAAVAAMASSLLRLPDPASPQSSQQVPSSAALFSALTAGQSALLHEELQSIAELVRRLDPASSDAVIPLRERVDGLLRREERAAAAAPPPMVLAQFASAIHGAASALGRGVAAPADPLGLFGSIAGLVAALVALLATPLALLRNGGGHADDQQQGTALAAHLDHGVRAAMEEMAKLRGDLTGVRQSIAQASSASERLASVADIVGGRVVETALTIERTAEQTSELPQRILEQAEILSEVSRRGREAATLLMRLIDDAAERDGIEAARLETLADAIETIRAETERCLGGIRPLLASLDAIAALPATLGETIDRAAAAANDRAAAGIEALLAHAEERLAPVLAATLEQAAARLDEARAAREAGTREALDAAVSAAVAAARTQLAASATEITAAIGTRLDSAAAALVQHAGLRLGETAERFETMVEPLHALVGQAAEAAAALAALRAELAAEAEQRPAIIDSIVTGVREEIQAGLAQDLGTLSEAVGTVIEASRPLSELVPALTEAASVIADNATGQTEALARLEEAIDRLAATDQSAELRRTLLPLAQGLSGSVASLAELRGDLSAAVEKLVPALGGVETLAASIDAAAHSGSTASGAVADAARRLDSASQAIGNAARELAQAARVPPEPAGRGPDDRVGARPGSVTDAILSSLESEPGTKTAFAAIRSTLTEIDVVQDAVARLARQAEALAEDVAARRLASLPEPVQKHLPDLLAAIDTTIGRLHSAATAIAYATDGEPVRGAA